MIDPRERSDQADGSEPSDGALVEAWRKGDGAALERLVRRHQTGIYRLVLRATGDPTSAEDLVQKTFLKALGRMNRLRNPEAFRGWLYRTALNLARNRRRNARRWFSGGGDDLEKRAAPAPGADEALVREERAETLRSEIERLPRLQREVVRLRLDAELPFKEVAKILGTSEASAKVSYHHAVRVLRTRLGTSP